MESGVAISNVTGFTVTWDGHSLQASLSLDGSLVEVPVHHVFTVTDSAVEEEVQGQGQDEQTPTSVSVPVVPVLFSASDVASEPSTSSEATDGVPAVEEAHSGDTEPELPVVGEGS
jgi:hypothetical protein